MTTDTIEVASVILTRKGPPTTYTAFSLVPFSYVLVKHYLKFFKPSRIRIKSFAHLLSLGLPLLSVLLLLKFQYAFRVTAHRLQGAIPGLKPFGTDPAFFLPDGQTSSILSAFRYSCSALNFNQPGIRLSLLTSLYIWYSDALAVCLVVRTLARSL